MKFFTLIVMLSTWCVGSIPTFAQSAGIRVHDPVMAKYESTYYLFATGRGIAVWSSTDLTEWKREAPVFSVPPAWTTNAVATFKGHYWAPDISYHDGQEPKSAAEGKS